MSNRFKKIKTQKSQIYEKLLQEAATLENNLEFMERCRDNPVDSVLMLLLHQNGHMHGVYPDGMGEKIPVEMLKRALGERFGIDLTRPEIKAVVGNATAEDYSTPEVKVPKRIVFHNRQAIGDILMFTCAVRDFKAQFPEVEVQVNSTAMHIWDHNPNINRETWSEVIDPMSLNKGEGKLTDQQRLELNQRAVKIAIQKDIPTIVYIGPGKATNASNRSDRHFANAYRISMETVLGVRIPQGPIRPDIYMSEEEYSAPPIVEPPYWLITAGEKGDWTCKTYPFSKWQEVVKQLSHIKFVQLGSPGHKHPELSGDNVVNLIGQTQDRHTGIRNLFNLFNYCEGSMGLVSFQMHLAAAFNKPCVVIAGAREPVHFTRYPGQQYLSSDGCLPCTITKQDAPTACWFCKIERCPYHSTHGGQEVPLCADLFSSDDVVFAIIRYYLGGRLDINKPVGRSKLVTVVKDKIASTVKKVAPSKKGTIIRGAEYTREELEKLLATEEGKNKVLKMLLGDKEKPEEVEPEEHLWGLKFGGGAITDRDWEFMKSIIRDNKVKTVLEFGAGLSTLLLNDLGLDVVTYEDRPGWIDFVKKRNPDVDIRLWNGTFDESMLSLIGEKKSFDLAFVDGPAGSVGREWATKAASMLSELVIIHDAGRVPERKWQAKYLDGDFYIASKGGHRCHFWRKGQLEPVVFEPSSSDKVMKFVFNGRGEGGAERTCCWLMKEFVNSGWKVQYLSPNSQPCGTFRNNPVEGVVFMDDLSELKKPCDLLFLYANDWIWEFAKLNGVFSDLKALRKVMGINYKMGGIGRAEWTFGWDKYIFLNSMMCDSFIQRCEAKGHVEWYPDGRIANPSTKVLAPPTDLTIYFNNQPNYNGNLRLIRHSSQGDAKYPKDFNEMLTRIFSEVPDVEVFLMPAPSFLSEGHKNDGRVNVFQKNQPPVPEFLSHGNVFWYALPGGGYTEGGPKVIMEAQASGLPVIADNHSGAIDRLKDGGGYLCNSFDEHIKAMRHINTPERREFFGQISRRSAMKNYNPNLWIQEIIGIGGHDESRCTVGQETDICRSAQDGI